MQKKMDYKIEGGYLPVYQAEDISQALPLNSIKLNNGQPVIGTDGLPVFNQYAFMPDINLSLGLRNAYTVGMMLEQPLYMGGKVRSAFRMASIGREMAGLNVVYNRMEVLTEVDEAYCQYLRVLEQEKAGRKISGSGEGVGSECGRCSSNGNGFHERPVESSGERK